MFGVLICICLIFFCRLTADGVYVYWLFSCLVSYVIGLFVWVIFWFGLVLFCVCYYVCCFWVVFDGLC